LAGYRGIVLTQAWAGTYATELLAFMGAEVIQLETHTRLDSWRGAPDSPMPAAVADREHARHPWNCSPQFNSVNLNKQCDLSEPLGDLSRGIARYRENTGFDFEARDVIYQSVRFCIFTPTSVCFLCAKPPPGLNLVQYQSWNLVYGRIPLQLIAELEGVEIEPPELPEPRDSRHAPVFDALIDLLGADDYRFDTARRVAEVARQIDRRGARLEEQDLEEAAALLGGRPSDWRDADARLEARAVAAGEDERAALLRFLVRRSARREALLGAAMRELVGARAQSIRL
jgi:hypothetical protein